MHRGFLSVAAVLGALSVGLGAFAAHAMKGKIGDHAIVTFETGVKYQFYHVLALLAAAAFFKDFKYKTTIWACRLFVAGIILFSGSLYFLAFLQASVKPGYKYVGMITPFGGLAFILAWLLMLISFIKKKKV